MSVAATALTMFGMSSCVGDLDVTPIDPTTVMVVDADALFNKCYSVIAMESNGGANGDCDIDGIDGGTSGMLRQLWNANELTTEEAMCCWGDEGIPAFNYNTYDGSHPMLEGLYNRLYLAVTLCNHYLEVAEAHDATFTAEVRFLRAFYYYYLLDCFGNVPFTLEVSSEAAPQIQRADLAKWIEEEILEIEDQMKDPRTNTYGRVDKAAVWMLMARLCLNAEVYTGTARWADAATYAKKVMNSSYTLFTTGNGDYSAYQMLFMGNNGENGAACEAIFPIMHDGLTATTWGGPLFFIAAGYKSDIYPSVGTTEAWAGNRARKEFVQKFFPNDNAPESVSSYYEMAEAAGDDRALLWSTNRTLSIEETGEFTSGYSVCKYTNVYSDGGASHHTQFIDVDFFIMRAAEAYLTYAEATFRANGSCTSEVTEAINALRERANATQYTAYTLDEILDEWSREFYWEARRRTDLIRFGYYGGTSDYKWEWKGGAQSGTNFSSNKNIFAIPDSDINVNSNLTQNPGY